MKNIPAENSQDEFLVEINRYKGMIYKIANAYCINREDQKDLVQEIIYQLWRSYGRYDGTTKMSTWIYRIALNMAISNLRKSKVRQKYLTEMNFVHVHIEEKESLSEEIVLLRKFINGQKKIDKALLLLYLDERPYEEVAQILGISKSNVGTKINRLKMALKEYIKKNLN